ncbi:PfkB family carbohydrate kinase [Herbiconiux sp. KACC 21604]|uniref:1-phosphofructokinase family hexose kinase n=1 Tax=unclassified Herbiconiux TaxID=2618217 RepID=UPI001490C1C0|nr:PfkB family carbohydrate kinase [Herbiconiux sp. SALV-R1]QJU53120.1 1-phosphofructokinase family hexose kinase [Herbiconiux sp. SALV-R1]WPO88061.1 PfkB family carbohydrate kinase [Herbiconiux sp. KACC 21604]
MSGRASARRGIVTLTPAPAIDLTYRLGALELGEVNRAVEVHAELSGKGVNVARAVALSAIPVAAVLALGSQGEALAREGGFAELLAGVPDGGRTRINTTLLDASGTTTKVNESPVPVTPALWRAIAERTERELERLDAEWLVVSGSIPVLAGGGGPVPFLDAVRRAAERGVRVAVDTAGASLRSVVGDLAPVALLKPNTHELAELTGLELRTLGDVTDAALRLHDAGCDIVYVSMGADGALAVSDEGVMRAFAPATVVNTAGAGDASLAGFLVGAMGGAGAAPAVGAGAGEASLGAGAGAGAPAGAGLGAAPSGAGTAPPAGAGLGAALRGAAAGRRSGAAPDVAAGLALAASWGAHAVMQPTTLLSSVETAPAAVLELDPDPSTPLREPATP